MSWLWELYHKPLIQQTPMDRFWLHIIPVVGIFGALVLAAVISVLWDELKLKRKKNRRKEVA